MVFGMAGVHQAARTWYGLVVRSSAQWRQTLWNLYGSCLAETAAICAALWHPVTLHSCLLSGLHPQVAQCQTVWKHCHPVSTATTSHYIPIKIVSH